ncbi:MAG: hypothetical protein DRR06_17335, partial [Gammaproteobacteria bacterium]
MLSSKKPLNRTLIACCTLLPLASQVHSASLLLEEVVVVAQKREQNLQDVGISVSAHSARQMKAFGWQTSEDIAIQTPGLTSSKLAGGAGSHFNIRGSGQGDFAEHHESPNAVYQDEAYISSSSAAGLPLFDFERVEVLRGPQGTLFGRNATGGLIHFISAKPTDETSGYVTATLGEYSQTRLEGAISGALSDRIQGRFSFYNENADGYVENRIGPDLRDQDLWAARGQLQFDLSDKADLWVKVQGFSEDVRAGVYQHRASYDPGTGVPEFVPPDQDPLGGGTNGGDFYGYRDTDGDVHAGAYDVDGYIKKDVVSTTWKLNYQFENVDLVWVSDFQDVETDYREDTDGSPFNQTSYTTTQDMQQWSQELRISGDSDLMNWVAGVYYLNIDGDYTTIFDSQDLANLIDPVTYPDKATSNAGNMSDWSLETKSWSVFAQAEWELTETFTLITGIRWTDDQKDFSLDSRWFEDAPGAAALDGWGSVGDRIVDGVNLGPAVADIPEVQNLDQNIGEWSGKVQLDYRPNSDWLVYISANKGIKGGGYTAPIDGLLAVSELEYKPEELISLETGFKYEWDRGRLNVSVFHYDYTDFQTFEFSGLTSVVLNKDAEFYGGEIELQLNPIDNLDVNLGVALLDTEVKDVTVGGVSRTQHPLNAPESEYNWLFRYVVPLGGLELSFQYDGAYRDERFFNIVNAPNVAAEA